jgi:hypothetical protein
MEKRGHILLGEWRRGNSSVFIGGIKWSSVAFSMKTAIYLFGTEIIIIVKSALFSLPL